MAPPAAVYMLKPNLIDPRFRGFIIGRGAKSVLGHKRAYDDLLVDDGESLDWRPQSLSKNWIPMPVTGPVNPFNDYPCLEIAEPVFSRRAIDALGDMLTKNGELLPLKTDVGEYCLYIVMTKLDALDSKKSRLCRSRPGTTALDIEYFAFKRERLPGAAIFRVREHPNIYLVTDSFKERVEQAGLNGFNFIKVWPLPESANYRLDEAARRRKSKTIKLAGQALILRFRLGKQRPNPREKKLAEHIQASLIATLRVRSLRERYLGSVQTAEFSNGEFRVFCTCPDCEKLGDHLADWLDTVPWDCDIAIIKRFGNLFDKKAKEEHVLMRQFVT